MTTCPLCGGECLELGALGHRMHYRCRRCGMDHSMTVPEPEPPYPWCMSQHRQKCIETGQCQAAINCGE